MSKEMQTGKICLVGGEQHEYYCCSTRKNTYNKYPIAKSLEWIGKGAVHTIDGVKQTGSKKYNFWRKK